MEKTREGQNFPEVEAPREEEEPYMFRTGFLSIIRSLVLYTQQ